MAEWLKPKMLLLLSSTALLEKLHPLHISLMLGMGIPGKSSPLES